MKERPILFSGPMVRAILRGEKWQTRRVIVPQPPEWVRVWNGSDGAEHFFFDREQDDDAGRHWPSYERGLLCPYGAPGDRLWVRETWHHICVACGVGLSPLGGCVCGKRDAVVYKADGHTVIRWRPSIHMPRWASRISLDIAAVRVERLQDISEADARAEGVEPDIEAVPVCCGRPVIDSCGELQCCGCPEPEPVPNYVQAFASLWESLNAKRGHGWDTNPWVWVVEFTPTNPHRLTAGAAETERA